MKKRFALLLVPFALVLTGCNDSNGWDALPLDDSEDTCYQITKWESSGFNDKSWAVGVYCPAESPPKEN